MKRFAFVAVTSFALSGCGGDKAPPSPAAACTEQDKASKAAMARYDCEW